MTTAITNSILLLGFVGALIYMGVTDKVEWKFTGSYIGNFTSNFNFNTRANFWCRKRRVCCGFNFDYRYGFYTTENKKSQRRWHWNVLEELDQTRSWVEKTCDWRPLDTVLLLIKIIVQNVWVYFPTSLIDYQTGIISYIWSFFALDTSLTKNIKHSHPTPMI